MNCGLRTAVFEREHREKMGEAIWLFGWLVGRQTVQRNGVGFVLGKRPLSDAEIAEDMHESPSTVRKWRVRLREHGYIDWTYGAYKRMRIVILNAKKLREKQIPMRLDAISDRPVRGGHDRPHGGVLERPNGNGGKSHWDVPMRDVSLNGNIEGRSQSICGIAEGGGEGEYTPIDARGRAEVSAMFAELRERFRIPQHESRMSDAEIAERKRVLEGQKMILEARFGPFAEKDKP